MEITFYVAGLIAILATLCVITQTNPVHALLYLITSLLALSAVFFALGAYLQVPWKSSSTPVPLWCCSCSWS